MRLDVDTWGGGEASRESILDISEEHQVGQSGQSRMGRAGGVETRDLMGGVPCGPPCGPWLPLWDGSHWGVWGREVTSSDLQLKRLALAECCEQSMVGGRQEKNHQLKGSNSWQKLLAQRGCYSSHCEQKPNLPRVSSASSCDLAAVSVTLLHYHHPCLPVGGNFLTLSNSKNFQHSSAYQGNTRTSSCPCRGSPEPLCRVPCHLPSHY